jgi:transcription antitermination factor NusG
MTERLSVPISNPNQGGRDWLAVRVRSNFEKHVSSSIHNIGIEEFLPLYQRQARGHRAQDKVTQPLFSGYVFCRASTDERPTVLRIPGVVDFLGFNKRAIPIEEAEIDAVRRLVQGSLPICAWPFMRAGQRIRIATGPLLGLEGIVLHLKSTWCVVVSVTLLQRSVAVEVDASWLTAA